MKSNSCLPNVLFFLTGKKNPINLEPPNIKLKALYTFVKKLYFGGANTIKAVRGCEQPPHKLADMVKELSTVPE